MTVLYFSSTGNCLYVAKCIGGKIRSIPKCMEDKTDVIKDSEVGIVFPVYCLCIPPFIREFIETLTVETSYFFAVATYGFFPGAVCSRLKDLQTKNGRKFNYINRLKMAENCITFSDMGKQKGDSPKQQKHLDEILTDLREQKSFVRCDSPFKKMMTNNHLKNYEYETGVGITEKISISESCVGCGTCQAICPRKNISMSLGKPVFGKDCISCGACIQNCPENAIHHTDEKSSARYRNPHIELKELLIS